MSTQPAHYHLLTVKYIGPTNSRASRVKISSDRFKDSKTIGYNYSFKGSLSQAIAWCENNGFNVVGTAEGNRVNYIITSDFHGVKG